MSKVIDPSIMLQHYGKHSWTKREKMGGMYITQIQKLKGSKTPNVQANHCVTLLKKTVSE